MRQILLIRHAQPTIDQTSDARDWVLSDAGRTAASALGATLGSFNIETVLSSTEAKAIESAELIAAALGLDVDDQMDEFDEHDRRGGPFLDDAADFVAAVESVFADPSEIVFGNESAFDARGRFSEGLWNVLDEMPNGNIAIVTHGTVMALAVAAFGRLDARETWHEIRTRGMPMYIILSAPDLAIVDWSKP